MSETREGQRHYNTSNPCSEPIWGRRPTSTVTPDQVAKIVERCSGPDAHWDYLTTYTADLVNDLANLFAASDPVFDREEFLKGCGRYER